MIDGSFVESIAGLTSKPQTIGNVLALPEGWTQFDPASLVKPGPQVSPIKVNSLAALRDYLKANRDALELRSLAVHVSSPGLVRLLGPIDPRSRSRETFIEATTPDLMEGFGGQFKPHEEFIIGLQTRFVESDERAAVLRVIGTVKEEKVKQSVDDGISQTVIARNGGVMVADVAVPNPVRLAPYRTFREVAQTSSLFVLRAQAGREGGLPTVALFEADGGAWKLDAIVRVGAWLASELPSDVAVLA